MASRLKYIFILMVLVAVLITVMFWVLPFVRGIWPAVGPVVSVPSESPKPNESGLTGPLSAPDGWSVSLLTDKIPGARDIALDFQGNLWVSQPSEGTVSLITLDDNGEPLTISVVLRNLDNPHGLAFDPEFPTHLYIAQESQVSRVLTYSDAPIQKIADLPKGGRHTTRSLIFGPDGRIYVSVGSSCDTCRELNSERGSIISMNRDGSGRQIIAKGLRNAVFLAVRGNELWVTENGRDNLGDDLPPDEINAIKLDSDDELMDYGWPTCYGDRILDTDFDKKRYVRNPCNDTFLPEVNVQAHSAPLGLAFIPRTPSWPRQWQGDLFVAYHGSWNRSAPVGYKVVAFDIDSSGEVLVDSERDVVTGFLTGVGAMGRPVDVLPTEGGILYISDNKAGVVWQMKRK